MNEIVNALVVEPSKHVVKTVEEYFKMKGYASCSAEDGAEALHLCRKLKPEVVILTLDLPILDGFETLKKIRKDFPETKCIVTSALENTDVIEKCFRLGAVGFLVKPFTKEEFINTLNNSLKSQIHGKLYHIFLRSASRLDNAIRKLTPHYSVRLISLDVFPYEMPVKINYQNTEQRLVSMPEIKETRTWSAPEGKTGFVDQLIGKTEGKIVSFLTKDSIDYLNKYEDMLGDIEEFFDMVHAKIISEIAESFEREIYLKRGESFDAQTIEIPQTDSIRAEFLIEINQKTFLLETFVWLPVC